jgi:HEAT repeat protein
MQSCAVRQSGSGYGLAVCCAIMLCGCGDRASESGATQRLPTVQEWVNDLHAPEEQKRLKAVMALGEMGPTAKAALPALIAALRDPNRLVRVEVVWSLVFIDPTGDEVLIHLYVAVKDPDVGVRTTAVQAIGKLGPRAAPAIPELERLLLDPAPAVRLAAVQALVDMGPKAHSSRAFLEDISEHDRDLAVRQAAAAAARGMVEE